MTYSLKWSIVWSLKKGCFSVGESSTAAPPDSMSSEVFLLICGYMLGEDDKPGDSFFASLDSSESAFAIVPKFLSNDFACGDALKSSSSNMGLLLRFGSRIVRCDRFSMLRVDPLFSMIFFLCASFTLFMLSIKGVS